MYRTFSRTLLAVLLFFALFFAGELAFEWWRLGMPEEAAMSWAGVNNAKLVDLMSPLARAYNNVLAMLIATIGLAIPLTANMHTPKLIEMFIRDRLNQAVLFTMAFLAANTLFVASMIGPEFAPMWAVRFAVVGALVGWAMLVPYFFYVVRFLDPSNILQRLRRDVEGAIDAVIAGRLEPNAAQTIVHERVHQIGTIVIKSLDRGDRGVALEGIWIIKLLLDHHGARKARMPAAWFEVDRADFIGLSDEAIRLVQEEKVFFERKALQQLYLAHAHAVAKVPDAVSSVSDATRVVALGAIARGDDEDVRLCLRYFNNYLRESVRVKHVHSIYDVFYQYRLLATELLEKHAGFADEISGHMAYYADVARHAGLGFVPALAAFDLADVAAAAQRVGSAKADSILARTLGIAHEHGGKTEPLVLEAKVKLGGMLTKLGADAAVAKVARALASTRVEEVRRAEQALLDTPRSFHEVTDRQEDFRWIRPEDREALTAFAASVGARASG